MYHSDQQVKMFKLKQQIFAFLATFIAVILLLLSIFLGIMIGSFQKNQNQRRLSELDEYMETLDGSIRQLNNAVGSIYSASSSFQGISSYQSEAEKCGYVQELLSLLQVQIDSNRYLGGLFILYNHGDEVLYYTNNKLTYEDTKAIWKTGAAYLKSLTAGESTVLSYSELVRRTETDLFYSVFMKNSSAVISGSVSLSQGIPEQQEEKAAYGIIYEGEFYRTAGREAELSVADCAALKSGRNRIGNDYVYLYKSSVKDLAVVEIVPRSLWMYVQPWHIVLMVLMVCLTVWLLLLYRFIYIQLTEPLEDMTRTLLDIRQGEWDVHFTAPNRIAEIESVRQTVRLMLKEIGQYKIRSYEEELARQKTQLQFLQLQLAPHFYTNCLKNIYYMLMMKEYENAEQFLLRLSKHLRYLLQRDTTLVAVNTEKEFVENYISLQELLSSRPVTCTISVDKEVGKRRFRFLPYRPLWRIRSSIRR